MCTYLIENNFISKCEVESEEETTKLGSFLIFTIEMPLINEQYIPKIIQTYFHFIKKLQTHSNK